MSPEEDIIHKKKLEDEELSQMRTIVLIPTEPAPPDPLWLTKKHAGKKLDPIEAE